MFQIGDFGSAYNKKQTRENEITAQRTFIGITYLYAAPEWIASENNFLPTRICDVYRCKKLHYTTFSNYALFKLLILMEQNTKFQIIN